MLYLTIKLFKSIEGGRHSNAYIFTLILHTFRIPEKGQF